MDGEQRQRDREQRIDQRFQQEDLTKTRTAVSERFGLSAEETETVSWLVKNHLLMSNTAFKRDLDDPQTIAKFVEGVQSPERLRLLLCLLNLLGPEQDIRGIKDIIRS